MTERFNTALQWWAAHERPFSFASMIIGFCLDLFLAKRPDSVIDNSLLLLYLVLAAFSIALLNRRSTRYTKKLEAAQAAASSESVVRPEPLLLLLVLQFCFGGLASNLLVLYGKSGTPAGDLLFVGLLLIMLVGNEFLRTRYEQFQFNIAVFYLLLLTYFTIAVPTFLFHTIGAGVFVASGLLSLAAAALLIAALHRVSDFFRGRNGGRHLRQVGAIIGGIFAFFNVLYFSNIIPPVPLSLKEIGIYHGIVKNAPDSYVAQFEPAPWFEFWKDTSATYTLTPDDSAYCFSSVFAPTGLETPIVQVWQYLSEATRTWQTLANVEFSISGGRTGGYRGFSIKNGLVPGEWRCNIETSGGALIGREQFTVIDSSSTPQLKTATL